MISLGKRSVPLPDEFFSAPAKTLKAFLLERQMAGATPSTIRTYREQLQPFVAWCEQQDLALSALSIEEIRTYLGLRQRVSSSALFEATRRLKTFFKWCKQENICDDLCDRIRLPKREQKNIPALTVPQVRALLALCSKDSFLGRRDEALLRLLLDCGLRISEALALKTTDIDFATNRVFVLFGKGQKQRIVPVGPRTLKALLKYVTARSQQELLTDVLFVGENGRPLTRRHVEQHITRLAHRAGIEGVRVSPHTLRHTCALWYLKRGGDVFSLQQLLGHSTLEMTKRYIAMAQSDVAEAHAKYGAGDLV